MIARVLTCGSASAIPFIAGMVSGNACWLLAAIFGLSALAVRFATVFVVIKWLGIVYLLYVAWRLWSANPAQAEQTPRRTGDGFLPGALLTLGNPKAMVFFGAVLPQAFDMTALSAPQIGTILVLAVGIDFAMQSMYLLLARRARKAITSPQHMRVVNRSAAGMITGCTALIAARS